MSFSHEKVRPRAGADPDALTGHLQQILVDLIALQLQGKQAHWTVVGPGFLALHKHLDEIVDEVRDLGDRVAERIRALGDVPDGRAPTVVAGAGLEPFPLGEQDTSVVAGLIAGRLRTVAGAVRAVHDEVDAQDPTTADVLHQVIESVEKHAWMLGAEARRDG
jgi:starvation-inducible DNA-binding protein